MSDIYKCYLCGKVSGLPRSEVKGKFKRLENRAFKLGYEPVNPIIHSNISATWESEMKRCITLLCSCEVMLIATDFRNSEGAKIEVELGKKLGLILIFE